MVVQLMKQPKIPPPTLSQARALLSLPLREPTKIQKRNTWLGILLMTILSILLRFIRLGFPHKLVFDETYYVKDAYSILISGYEITWPKNADSIIAGGGIPLPDSDPAYVVHPPLGKLFIALGQWLFGFEQSYSWRVFTAVFGVISVILVGRIAWRITYNPLISTLASGFMAIDGMGIVLSRTGILDNILAFWVLLGFWALLRDRQWAREKLAAEAVKASERPSGNYIDTWGPKTLWWRPWTAIMGVILGLACAVKWSALFPLAICGLMVFLWETNARRILGTRNWISSGIYRCGIPAFFTLIPISFLTYLSCWSNWFLTSGGYYRQWATQTKAAGKDVPFGFLPDALSSLLHYHRSMWTFHNTLSKPHTYSSQAWQWILQLRPTSFYWDSDAEQIPRYTQAITSLGNPFLWWLALAGTFMLLVWFIRYRDWRAGFILAGYLSTWAPWIMYTNRTIYQFYAVIILPFVCLSLSFFIGWIYKIVCPLSANLSFANAGNISGSRLMGLSNLNTLFNINARKRIPHTPEYFSVNNINKSFDIVRNSIYAWNKCPYKMLDYTFFNTLLSEGYRSPRGIVSPNKWEKAFVWVVITLIVLTSIFFYPIWTGMNVPYLFWRVHMWLPSWV